MKKGLKIAGAIAKSQCAFIFINQLREKVGIMFGNPEGEEIISDFLSKKEEFFHC